MMTIKEAHIDYKNGVMGTMHEVGYFEGKIDSLEATNFISLYGIAKDTLRRSLKIYCENAGVCFQ